MPLAVHVAIPLCHSTEDREKLHRWNLERWREMLDRKGEGWTLAYATDRARQSEDEPPRTTDQFNHPKAINRAVRGGVPNPGHDRDVIVFCDADTFPDPETFDYRIDDARFGRWSCPARYVNLSQPTTEQILRTGSWEDAVEVAEAARDHVWEGEGSWSGIVVIRRDQFEEVGGYDERHDGWWADDIAFAMSVETLVAPVLRLGTVYHLWHEARRDQTYDRPGFAETWTLTSRYQAAHGNVEAMRALIAERPTETSRGRFRKTVY